jgi:ABC-type branched-subunit amino acid transport system substrate-binding protein
MQHHPMRPAELQAAVCGILLDIAKPCSRETQQQGKAVLSTLSIQVVVSTISLAVTAAAAASPIDDRTGVLKGLTAQAGRLLGAASACPDISAPRVKAIEAKIISVIRASGQNDDETRIFELLAKAQAEGARLVASKQIDCTVAERELVDLETASSPTSQASALPTSVQIAAPAGADLPAGVRGITADEIRFGASLPLTGPNKNFGQEIRAGVTTAFEEINDAGGVYGRLLRFLVADDGYEPARTSDALRQLYEKDQVFGFIGNVGTATAAIYVPFALEHRMVLFAPGSGSLIVRRDPPDRYVFNYRPSYVEETEAAVRYLVKLRRIKPEQIAVFAQEDAFGEAGFQGVMKAMRAIRGGDGGLVLRLGYPRNTIDVEAAVTQLKAAKPPVKAIVMVATFRAAVRFIEKSRDAVPGLLYTNTSVIASSLLRDELMLLGSKYAGGIVITQAVPAADGWSSLVLEYKAALAKYAAGEPPEAMSLEYYIAGRILIEALKRAGPQLNAEKLVGAIEGMRDLDIGLGAPISFAKSEHQGSHKIWGLQLEETGKYVNIELQ